MVAPGKGGGVTTVQGGRAPQENPETGASRGGEGVWVVKTACEVLTGAGQLAGRSLPPLPRPAPPRAAHAARSLGGFVFITILDVSIIGFVV